MEYSFSLAPLRNYFRRVDEYEKKKVEKRWLNLAARTIVHRPIKKYSEFLGNSENQTNPLILEIDSRVTEINQILDEENVTNSLINPDNPLVRDLRNKFLDLERLLREN